MHAPEEQLSVVQKLLSLHEFTEPPPQTAEELQVSPTVQKSPSSQDAPVRGACTQLPIEHVSRVQNSPSSH